MKPWFACTLTALFLAGCGSHTPASSKAPARPAAASTRASAGMPDQPGDVVPPMSAAQLAQQDIRAAVAGDWRSAADKARDRYRHPQKTLVFFGIRPDMTVIEITPGGGWYAAILAPLLRQNGHYVAAVMSPLSGAEAARQDAALRKTFAADPAVYGKAEITEFDPNTPNLGTPASADMVLTFRNVHNWTDAGHAQAMFKAFYRVLKPGGVLGVVDHRADAGATPADVHGTGYLPQAYVVKLAEDAGFKLSASSEINANPKDTKDYPKGVWTLPPTLVLGDKDKAKYLAIGESDRMTLRFVKPSAPAASASSTSL